MKHLHLTRVLACALALVLLLGCTACGKKTADDTGDTVGQKDTQTTVELDGKFTLNYSASAGMNPYKTQNSDNLAVCGLVYETLTELTDSFEAEPGLFTEWSSDDGETWTFTVAAGRTFHDGHALTAQDAAYSIQQESQRKTIEITRADADIARREKEAELAEKEIAIQERKLDAEVRKAADAKKYQAEREAEAELARRQREADAQKYEAEQQAQARRAEAEAQRYAMEQEAEGIRARGLAEAEAIERKAEAQCKMGEASILEMYLAALPEVVKNAALPLAQTDKIVMYGDGNPTRMVRDVMNSSGQIIEGLKEATGIDLTALLSAYAAGKQGAQAQQAEE